MNSRKTYVESGIEVDLGKFSHCRFEICPGYQSIKGDNIKEIDFGWWNEDEKCFYLLELKDYSNIPGKLKENSEKLLENLWKKSLDMVIMLAAVWLKTGGSSNITSCFPPEAVTNSKCRIKIFHLINCTTNSEPHLLWLNDKLKNKFKGYQKLFDNIRMCKIISIRKAENMFDFIKKI